MEGTRNLLMIQEAGETWETCLFSQLTLTSEYLLGTLNTSADNVSIETKNSSSEWILNRPIFLKLMQALRPEDVDLFASRFLPQIPKYISWQPDSQG